MALEQTLPKYRKMTESLILCVLLNNPTSGPAKSGGWFASEPFHLTFMPKKSDGTPVTTTNPNANNKVTVRHHFYIASSKADLEAKAAAWDAAQKAAAAKK